VLSRLGVEVGEKRIGTTMRSTLRALLSRRVSYPGEESLSLKPPWHYPPTLPRGYAQDFISLSRRMYSI
jgi:hypothetical protein